MILSLQSQGQWIPTSSEGHDNERITSILSIRPLISRQSTFTGITAIACFLECAIPLNSLCYFQTLNTKVEGIKRNEQSTIREQINFLLIVKTDLNSVSSNFVYPVSWAGKTMLVTSAIRIYPAMYFSGLPLFKCH